MKKSIKMKIKSKVTLLAATICVGLSTLQASPTLTQQIDKLPAVEIPAFAVKSVLSADEKVRLESAVKLVRTIAVTNERALVPTVVSIARAIPQFGPKVAAEAAKLSPNQAKIIAVRVAQAVPALAADVAFQVVGNSKLSTNKAVEIAELIVRVAPASKDLTLSAVAHEAPASSDILFSRFPNALRFIFGGNVESKSGSLLAVQAEEEKEEAEQAIEDKNNLLNNPTALQDEANNRGISVGDLRDEIENEIEEEEKKVEEAVKLEEKAAEIEQQTPNERDDSETEEGVDDSRQDSYGNA